MWSYLNQSYSRNDPEIQVDNLPKNNYLNGICYAIQLGDG